MTSRIEPLMFAAAPASNCPMPLTIGREAGFVSFVPVTSLVFQY